MTTPTREPPVKITSRKFAETVGVSLATVTKLRTGGRLPSVPVLYRMIVMYELDAMTALTAYVRGPSVFSAWIRVEIFDDPRPHDRAIIADLAHPVIEQTGEDHDND